jgi:hypothetical protein
VRGGSPATISCVIASISASVTGAVRAGLLTRVPSILDFGRHFSSPIGPIAD